MAHHPLKPGSIVSASWGYSMTIVDFFEVTRTTPKGAYLRPIASRITETTGFLQGCETAVPGQYTGPEFFRRVDAKGRCKGENSSQWCAPWDGAPRFFNHCD